MSNIEWASVGPSGVTPDEVGNETSVVVREGVTGRYEALLNG